MQVSTFGIMPPEMVPSAISLRASFTDSSGMSFFDLSSTPGTSVSSNRRLAFSGGRQRRQHWNELITDQLVEQREVHLLGIADKTEIDRLLDVGVGIDHAALCLRRLHHAAVLAGQAHRLAAGLIDISD